MMKECKHCGVEFNFNSPYKQRVGGYINECPTCVEENGGDDTPVLRGYGPPGGEAGSLHIVKFKNEKEANEFTESLDTDTPLTKQASSARNTPQDKRRGVTEPDA